MEQGMAMALDALRQAIALETEGRDFYIRAAGSSKDTRARETFLLLASDEKVHLDLVQRQYDSLRTNGEWTDVASHLPRKAPGQGTPVFPRTVDEIKKRTGQVTTDTDALLFGMDIETRSYDRYRKAADETTAGHGKAMYNFLAGQEQGHFNLLMLRYEAIAGPVGWRY